MTLISDIQTLEPGSEVRLFEVDGTSFGADILRFHGHNVPHTPEEIRAAIGYPGPLPAKSIWWQGEEYKAWPVQIEGIETNSDGSPASPVLSVGNVDGSISALCLAFQDMAQAKVSIHETFAKYLDAQNFPEGYTQADPEQEAIEIWYIDSKNAEDDEIVSFNLSSPADLSGQRIPARQLTPYCHWCMTGRYRGPECSYTGSAMFTEDDEPTDDPSLDMCSGTIRGCELRFGANEPLNYGGFPAVSLIRR